MVDEIPPLTKEQRREREKELRRALRRKASGRTKEPAPTAAGQTADTQEVRGKKRRKPLTAADVKGLKYFDKLAPLFERLHNVGCERDKADNRDLHYDQLCLFLLLGLFNPVVDGLRGLQQASEDAGQSVA